MVFSATKAKENKEKKEKAQEEAPKPTLSLDTLKKGDIVGLVEYSLVTGVNGTRVNVQPLHGQKEYQITGRPIIESYTSCSQFVKTETVTKTRAAEILSTAHNTPFTVEFYKAEGERRVLRGRLMSPEPLLGRSHVEDLDIPADQHRLRLVDHREIISIIINNVKYEVKGK